MAPPLDDSWTLPLPLEPEAEGWSHEIANPVSDRACLVRPGEMTTHTDTAEIVALIERVDLAYRTKDADAVAAAYAPDAVMFDLAPPLAMAFDRTKLAEWFATWDGPLEHTWQDRRIRVSGDLGVCTALLQTRATKQGERAEFWIRCSLVFARGKDCWKVVHEHSSVPFHMDGSYRAATDLKP